MLEALGLTHSTTHTESNWLGLWLRQYIKRKRTRRAKSLEKDHKTTMILRYET
jgi:hypothetical protein